MTIETAPAAVGPTIDLPPRGAGVNNQRPLKDILRYSAGSFAGNSAVSNWLECPEKSRLETEGIGLIPPVFDAGFIPDLAAAPFGTLQHALRSERLLRGSDAAYALLDAWAPELSYDDYQKSKLIWRIYDTQFPLGSDGWEYLGVECEVRTALQLWDGRTVIRSVRYDSVIRIGGNVYSFECKTMRSAGRSALQPYKRQAMIQQALWNANPALVDKYGRMDGVVFDCIAKTVTPTCERTAPSDSEWSFSKHQEGLARQWLRMPDETVRFFRDPVTGRFPQFLHACWGKWNPCVYIPLCHEEAFGMYQYADGRTYVGA